MGYNNNFVKEKQCAEPYQNMGLCHTYFFKEFNIYPSVLSINDEYLKTIKAKNFHDPILTYVALYLYHNYKIAQEYFKIGKNIINKSYGHDYNTACAVLNRWLNQEKNLYTNFGKCSYNLRWWNIHIEPLWETLKKYFPNKKCERSDPYDYVNISLQVPDFNDRCYNHEVEDHVCYKDQDDDKESLEENCAKLSILFYLGEQHSLLNEITEATNQSDNKYCPKTLVYENINYNPVLKAEKSFFCESLTSTIALPIIVTVLGTIFLAFFLNEFTPMGSILRNNSKNKVRLLEQFNDEAAYKEYETSRNNNQNLAGEKSIIYYKSMNE